MYLFKVLCLLLAVFYVASKTLGGTNTELKYEPEENKRDDEKKDRKVSILTDSEDGTQTNDEEEDGEDGTEEKENKMNKNNNDKTETEKEEKKKVATKKMPVISRKEKERRKYLNNFKASVRGMGCLPGGSFGVIDGPTEKRVDLKCDANTRGSCGLKMGQNHQMAFKFTATKELVAVSEKLTYHFCAKMGIICLSDVTIFPNICSLKGIECPLVEGKEYVVVIDKKIRNLGISMPVAARISLRDGNGYFATQFGCVEIPLLLMT